MASRALSLSRASSLLRHRPLDSGAITGVSPAVSSSGVFRSFVTRHCQSSLNDDQTVAQVFDSEEEVRMKISSVSARGGYMFGALVSEDLSWKLKELLTVRGVLPDSGAHVCRTAQLTNSLTFTRSFLSFPQNSRSSIQNILPPASLSKSKALRFFSSETGPSDQNPESSPESISVQSQAKDASLDVQDVDNKELKKRIEQYFKGDEEALPSILEAILARKISGKHEDTDDELMDELRFAPVDGVKDVDFESDFEDEYSTDEEINNLYNVEEKVAKEMLEDEYFNMDDKKWNDMIREAIQEGNLRDMRQCEEILEDMLHFDELLPDDIKQKVQQKFDELGDKCERKELEPEDAYKLFAEFEDQLVKDHMEKIEAEGPPQSESLPQSVETKRSDDPPGVGPILRWQTRAVFAPGGDAWHPKNRKVKLSVTVKELGLSQYQFRRLREIVGKRYHAGRDELTIISERFEHREENRKDCLRTLLSVIEEAGKADALIEEARTSYVKQRLKANSAFMARLLAKTKQASVPLAA